MCTIIFYKCGAACLWCGCADFWNREDGNLKKSGEEEGGLKTEREDEDLQEVWWNQKI